MKIIPTYKKIMITISMFITIVSTMILQHTESTELPSQSAYAFSPGVVWYALIHTGIILTFFFLYNIYTTRKRHMYWVTGFLSMMVLSLDMFNFTILHNTLTVLLFLSACYCVIMYSLREYKRVYSIYCCILAILFAFAYFFPQYLSMYKAEMVMEWLLAAMILLDLHTKKYVEQNRMR